MRKKQTETGATPKRTKKTSDVKKIYKTTDGMFTGRPDIDKPRVQEIWRQKLEARERLEDAIGKLLTQ